MTACMARLFERWRSMDPGEKAALVGDASVALQDLTMAGLEQRLPDANRRELELTPAPGSEANVASAEDTVLQKLLRYRKGGEVSDRQWRDVLGVLKAQGTRLEREYLVQWGRELGVLDLLGRALVEAGQARLEP